MTAHWGIPDPAAVEGSSKSVEKAFRDAFLILDRRISLFLFPAAIKPGQNGAQEKDRSDRS
jgi:hypothetical protein